MSLVKIPKKFDVIIDPGENQKTRFSTAQDFAPKANFRIIDFENNTTWGYLTIDNTQRGPGLGGIRMVNDLNLNEVSRLARVMTLKNSSACLPYGGAKAGIILKHPELAERSPCREELMEKFSDCLFQLTDYAPAPDMGTDEWDIQIIHNNHSRILGTEKHSRGGAGRPVAQGGIPIDDWELTAHGLVSVIKALESFENTLALSKAKFIVQGFGNVGAPTALKLHETGAKLVGASDIHTALWNPKGLDVQALMKVRNKPGGLSNYPFEVKRRFSNDRLDWLLEAPCDILIPSARPDAITAKNVDRIECEYILQGANTPSSKPVEYYLQHRRDILSLTDFIVNSGGVIGCAVERKMIIDESYAETVKNTGIRNYVENLIDKTITGNVREIYSRMKKNSDLTFRDSACELAMERLNTQEMWL